MFTNNSIIIIESNLIKIMLMIQGNEVSLEAEFFQSGNEFSNTVVLLCHPHPQFL